MALAGQRGRACPCAPLCYCAQGKSHGLKRKLTLLAWHCSQVPTLVSITPGPGWSQTPAGTVQVHHRYLMLHQHPQRESKGLLTLLPLAALVPWPPRHQPPCAHPAPCSLAAVCPICRAICGAQSGRDPPSLASCRRAGQQPAAVPACARVSPGAAAPLLPEGLGDLSLLYFQGHEEVWGEHRSSSRTVCGAERGWGLAADPVLCGESTGLCLGHALG